MPFESWKIVTSSYASIAILLLVVDLVITAARAGFLNVRYARLLSLRDERGTKVLRTIAVANARTRLRSSFKLAQTLLRFSMGGLALAALIPLQAFLLSGFNLVLVLVAAAASIWFLEFLVERGVMGNAEIWAIRLTSFTRLLLSLSAPFLFLPMRLLRGKEGVSGQLITITEDELKSLVDASQRAGVLEQDERKMIFSIFELGDTLVREIMVPRIDMFTLEVNTPLADAADQVLKTGYSRVPVFEEQVDNVIGILYTKDMLRAWRQGNHVSSLRSVLRPPNFIPETKKVDELLAEMQTGHIHIAIVVDEYGGVAGLVTFEDIVEEIVGEIQDEYDQGEEMPYQELDDGEFLFRGRIDLDDFNEILEVELDTTEADSLSGLIYRRLGRVPKPGEVIDVDNVRLTIEQVASRRIRKVRALRLTPVDGKDDLSSLEDQEYDNG